MNAEERAGKLMDTLEQGGGLAEADIVQTIKAAQREAMEKCENAIPMTRLDELLTGPSRIGDLPYNGKDVECLLNALRSRIRTLIEKLRKE